jgi:WD40 repeat protein
MAISPDGRQLAISSVDRVRPIQLRDSATGQLVGELKNSDGGWFRDLMYSTDGRRLVSGTGSGRLMLWDVPARKLVHSLAADPEQVDAVAFHLDGRLVASGAKTG